MSDLYKPYWIVGDKKIHNQLEAEKFFAKNTELHYSFSFLEKEYDTIDWTQEPNKTWEELSLERAIHIRQKYKKIKLFFSGGRDSGYLFRVFENAGIPIDELIVPYNPYNPQRSYEHLNYVLPLAKELCRRNPKMILREICQDSKWFDKIYTNYDWIESKKRCRNLMFSAHDWNLSVETDPDYHNGNCGYIFGFEKPQHGLKLVNGEFIFQFSNRSLDWAPQGLPGLEYFYWAPEQPEYFVKQCWLLINHLEKHYPGCTPEFVEKFHDHLSPYYDEMCRAIGRGEPMSWQLGCGKNKITNNEHWSIKDFIKTAQKEKWRSIKEYIEVINHLNRDYNFFANSRDGFVKDLIFKKVNGKKYFIKKQNIIK
jgi:hypothetical protein